MIEKQPMADALNEIVSKLQDIKGEWITKVPGIGSGLNKMLDEFDFYQRLLEQPVGIMVMGRTGSGKSSFINAFVDDHEFMKVGHSAYSETKQVKDATYKLPNGAEIAFIDTRGSGEAGLDDADALAQIRDAAKSYLPSVIFILMPPDRSHWDEDLTFFAKAAEEVRKVRKAQEDSKPTVNIVGLITKIDTVLDPFDPRKQYTFDAPSNPGEEKISHWCKRLRGTLETKLSEIDNEIEVFPVSCRFGTNDEGEFVDKRWGLDDIENWLGMHAPFDVLFTLSAKLNIGNRKKLAKNLVHRFSALAGVTGAIPIPFADAPILGYLQFAMIRIIGSIANDPSKESADKLILTLGGVTTLIGKAAARQITSSLLKFVPEVGTIAGGVVSASIATAMTEGVGRAAIAYYFDDVPITDAFSAFKQIAATHRK